MNIYEYILVFINTLDTIGSGVIKLTEQKLDETDCISHCTNTLGKGMNPIILPPAMGK